MKAVEKDRTQQRQEAAQKEMQTRLDAAKSRYGEGSDATIVEAAKAIFQDQQIPGAIREVLNESDVLIDVLYTLGKDAEGLAEFVELAKSKPGAAMRKAVLVEKLVSEELGKGGSSAGETPERGADGKFVSQKPPEKKTHQRTSPSEGNERPHRTAGRRGRGRRQKRRFRCVSRCCESQGPGRTQRSIANHGCKHFPQHFLGEHGHSPAHSQQARGRGILQPLMGEGFPQRVRPGQFHRREIPAADGHHRCDGIRPSGHQRIKTSIALDQWIQCSFEWDDYEAAVKLERSEAELRENYLEPAAAAIAQDIDSRCANFARINASNVVGALGTDPTAVDNYYAARQIMLEEACPPGKRAMLISSSMMATLGSKITSVFHPADEITKVWKEGALGRLAGFDFFESNSLYSHTAGTWNVAGVTVTSAVTSGSTSFVVTGTASDTFLAGDKISILNVNRVNPMTRRVAGKAAARTFTVTQPLTLVGSGNALDVLHVLPAIYGPGSPYQNVDALPGAGAALTLWPGTTSPAGKVGTVGVALSKYAFAIVGAKLFVPTAVEQSGAAQDPQTGLSIRKVKAWDPVRSMQINRMDSLLGLGNLYQANGAVAVVGA